MEKRLYTAAVFASFAWNNRIPVEFSWNWKETAVCRNRPIFLLRSLRYPRYKTERFSIRPISQRDARYISHDKNFFLSNRLSRYLTKVSSAREDSSNHPCCFYRFDQNLRETSKSCARSKASSAPHQSLNRKRSRAVCRPIWRTSIFLPGYLPPRSTNHDSILDLARDFFPVQGSRAAIQGWKNRADGLDRCRSS